MEMKNVKEIIIPNPTYEMLEYIDLPSGCRISLNENGSSTIAYYIDAIWNLENISISSDSYPFGSIYSNGSTYFRYHLIASNSRGIDAASGNAVFTDAITASDWANRHVLELNYHTYLDKKVYVDNVEMGAFTPTAGTTTGYIRIGGRIFNNNGTITYNNFPATIRLFNMKSRTGASSESIFYPVRRKSDGKIGLFKVYNRGEAVRFCVTETEVEPIAGPLSSQNIDIPVSKITNANGDIIWGSYNAFPYRRLEYIHFNGSEYILTETPANNYYYLQFSLDSIINDKFIFGANGDSTSSGAMRITNRTASTGYYQTRYGRNSSGNTNIAQVSTNTVYQMRLRVYSNNTLYSALANSSGTLLGSNTFSAVSFTRANMAKFAIMGYNSGGTVGNMTAGKVFWYLKRETDGSSTILVRAYPCQRKSDGVCGLYDVLNNTFYPMAGTTITDAAAGPVLDEYWDLTAPA